MITLLLLPFFLASRISVDVDSLLQGPEYTYRVEINTINRDAIAGMRIKVFDVDGTLKCRPRVPDTLSCRFEAARMGVFMEGLELAQETVEDLWVDEEPFEIRFQKNGIAKLLVTRNMQPWTIDMIRAIVNQLNVGVDLRGQSDGNFIAKERSFLGECRTTIDMSHCMSEDSWKDDKFEILPMAGLRKESREILRIEKTRDLNGCIRKEDYFFASKSNYPSERRDATTVKSSRSLIVVSDANYTSYTENEIVIANRERTRNLTLYEKITLNLETISAAKTELPLIPDPTLVSFFVRDRTQGNSFYEGDKNDKNNNQGEGNGSTRMENDRDR